ncbi:MAG TPA: hypothetical protein VFG54_12115 [Prolixibacteraceae bacterium]|nr:hypothetical protein [Prolixibacteraceae bacterium]
MADRYLVGNGARNWNDPNNWAETSGGPAALNLLGPELVTNGGMESLASWLTHGTAVPSVLIGQAVNGVGANIIRITVSSVNAGIRQIILTVGKVYKVSGWVRSDGVQIPRVWAGGAGSPHWIGTISTQWQYFEFYQVANDAVFYLTSGNASAGYLEWDNISVKECYSIPTSADNVIFDTNSGTGTITVNAVANMQDFTCLNIQAITLANAAYNFNVYGSLTLHANLTSNFTGTGYLQFKATSLGKTITSNGNTASWNRLYFDGVGGEWTNQDDWNLGSTGIFHVNGTWNTNSKTITSTGNYILGMGIKTWTLGSSIINISSFLNSSNNEWGNFTIQAGTSTINCSGEFTPSTVRKTFYNVVAASMNGYNIHIFNNLTILSVNGAGMQLYSTGIVVNDTLTVKGTSAKRALIFGYILGTKHTITANNVVFEYVDFRDTKFTNPIDLSLIVGGSGDCGGNENITFTPSQTQYFKHTSGAVNWSNVGKWFSDQAKTIAGRVPLPQDDAVFDAGSFTGASTLTVDAPRIGRNLNMEAVNQVITMTLANTIECYGSFILGNNIETLFGVTSIHLYGRGNYILNTFAKTVHQVNIYSIGGMYTLNSNINSTSGIDQYYGTFDYNDFNATVAGILNHTRGSLTATYLGNGVLTSTRNSDGGAGIAFGAGALYAEGSTLKLAVSTGINTIIFQGGGKTFNKIWLSGGHTGNYQITGNNTIAELIVDAGKKVQFAAGSTQQIGKLTAIGTAANPITIGSITAAAHTLNKSGSGVINADYLNISYSNATPDNRWFMGDNSVDAGNNTGWQTGKGESFAAAMDDISDMTSQLMARGLMSGQMTEPEQGQAILEALAGMMGDWTEQEMHETILNAMALVNAAWDEEEFTAPADICIGTMIVAGFTEKEVMFWRLYEKITGKSVFTWLISKQSKFK